MTKYLLTYTMYGKKTAIYEVIGEKPSLYITKRISSFPDGVASDVPPPADKHYRFRKNTLKMYGSDLYAYAMTDEKGLPDVWRHNMEVEQAQNDFEAEVREIQKGQIDEARELNSTENGFDIETLFIDAATEQRICRVSGLTPFGKVGVIAVWTPDDREHNEISASFAGVVSEQAGIVRVTSRLYRAESLKEAFLQFIRIYF